MQLSVAGLTTYMQLEMEFQKHEVDYSSLFLQKIIGGSDLITKLNFQICQHVRIKCTEQQNATLKFFQSTTLILRSSLHHIYHSAITLHFKVKSLYMKH